MRRLQVFNNQSVDGLFADGADDFRWAHAAAPDPEWDAWVAGNASGGGALLFGRVTYELMAASWNGGPAAAAMPRVAAGMTASAKYVCSRTLPEPTWANTTVLRGDPVDEVRRLKAGNGPGLTVLGSGRLTAALAAAGLVEEFQVVVVPVMLGAGRSQFGAPPARIPLKLLGTRAFANGNVVCRYAPV